MDRLFPRELKIRPVDNPITGSSAVFLWGPRQTGKTTLMRERFPDAMFYDLLDSDLSARLSIRPALLKEEVLELEPERVVIDEVQKVPSLLDEVHWLLENTATAFILCGSSARKLRRKARNLLGGRAVQQWLFPLCSREVLGLDLDRMLNHGGLPAHYLADEPRELLKSYVNTYIKEEIIDESVTRNIPSFSRFLHIAGLTHGRQLNYSNVGRESGVSAGTVRNYYQILKDTLLGYELEPFRARKKRRLVETAKFFLFDIGVANQLNPEGHAVSPGSDRYGRAFEHFLQNEVRAYLEYRRLDMPLCYWRTSSGFEVDLIAGDMDLVMEFKSAMEARPGDLRGLRALMEEHAVGRALLVSRDERARKNEDGIEMMHWSDFCSRLWDGELL